MTLFEKIVSWLKRKLHQRFEDKENIQRFFRAEYGKDAEIAYHMWITRREMYTKYH